MIAEDIETAVPEALKLNGYKPEDWQAALTLAEAMKIYTEKTQGAIFCSWNVSFDWGFINEAFRKTKTRDGMDYHRLDVLSIAWDKELKHLDKWNLKKACEILAIPPEPDVHAALNGAMTAYKVFKKLQMC